MRPARLPADPVSRRGSLLLPALLGGTMRDILDLADKAARCTLRGNPYWTPEDWEDATQEAAAAIIALDADKGEGYAFLVAKSAIYSWLRLWLRHPRGGTLMDFLDYAHEPAEPATHAYLDALRPALHAQGATKAAEDMRYLKLRLEGYSTDGIALEMGISRRRVYAIRERTLPRLERVARGVVPPTRSEAVKAGKARARDA
jgi:DNA-directed RNA polymerase specialized sigma24 family protein